MNILKPDLTKTQHSMSGMDQNQRLELSKSDPVDYTFT